MMDIHLNDECVSVPDNATVQGVLQQEGYEGRPVAVALNGEFITRTNYEQTKLSAGDRLDIVSPMAGG